MKEESIDTIQGYLCALVSVVESISSALTPEQTTRVIHDLNVTRGTHRIGDSSPEAQMQATDQLLDVFLKNLSDRHSK